MGMRMGHDGEDGATSSLDLWPQFDGYPDPYEIKADSHIVGIRPALTYDNVTLKTNSPVEQLVADPTGRRIDKVVVKTEAGETVEYAAELMIVAAGALGSALCFCDPNTQNTLTALPTQRVWLVATSWGITTPP